MTEEAGGKSGLIATRLMTVVISGISGLYITRHLGPEGRGQFSALMSWCALAMLLHVGLPSAHAFLAARRAEYVPRLLSNLRCWMMGAFALLVVLWTLGAYWRGMCLETEVVGLMCALYCFISAFQMSMDGLLLGLGQVDRVTRQELLSRLLLALGYVALAQLNLARPAACIAVAVAAALPRVIQSYLSLPASLRQRWRPPSLRLAQCTWNYASKTVATSLLTVLIGNADLVLVDYFLGHIAAGQYAVATTINQLATYPFVTYWSTQFYQIAAVRDHDRRWQRFRAIIPTAVLGCLMACGMLYGASLLLAPILGSGFAPAAHLLTLMMAGYVCQVLMDSLGLMTHTASLSWGLILPPMAAAAATLAGQAWLTPRYGLEGSALAYCGARALWLAGVIFYVVYFRRRAFAQDGSRR